MNFIEVDGIQLGYKEFNPEAPQTVFFIHGNSSSCGTWNHQLNNKLLQQYHLIAVDLPGCGSSIIPKNNEWDYSLKSIGKVLAQAVTKLAGHKQCCLAGSSLGANIIAEMLNHSLSVSGICFLSSCVIGAEIGMDKLLAPGENISFLDEVTEEKVREFISNTLKGDDQHEIDLHTADFFRAKPPFRSALLQSIMAGKLSDEIAVLKSQEVPVLLAFGQDDNLINIDYLDSKPFPVWQNKVYRIPGAGHYLHIDQPEQLNTLLAEYLKDRFKAA